MPGAGVPGSGSMPEELVEGDLEDALLVLEVGDDLGVVGLALTAEALEGLVGVREPFDQRAVPGDPMGLQRGQFRR